MKVEYLHASKYGNGARVASEFQQQMARAGVAVDVHHMREMNPRKLPPAEIYVFSSPGRLGKPPRKVRRFLGKVQLAAGTEYALLTTEMGPQPDKRTGRVPTDDEFQTWERVRPIMADLLDRQGLVRLVEDRVLVTAIKGPLEDGWQTEVRSFVERLLAAHTSRISTLPSGSSEGSSTSG